ncbi:MAG: LamG-like jellyroll fold domain-containing protein, partial [Cyclobacteriaceae bacterium]
MKPITSKIKLGILSSFLFIHVQILAQNNALNFDGVNQNVTTTRTQVSGGLTYEAWVRTSTTVGSPSYAGAPGMAIIGDFDNNVGFSFGLTNGVLEVLHFNDSWQSVSGTTDVADGGWHHVAVSHEELTGEMVLYLDGNVEATGNITWDGNSEYHSFNRIGSSYTDGPSDGQFFNGDIDEVRIWNKPLSEAHINYHKDNELLSGGHEGLVAYYDFEDAIGTTLTNAEGTAGLNGTLQNMDNGNWISGNGIIGDPLVTEPDFVMDFDGVDDKIVIVDNPSLEPTGGLLTVEALIYNRSDNFKRIITKADGNSAGTDNGSFYFDTYDNTGGGLGLRAAFVNSSDTYITTPLTGEILALNTWHHVALVFDQGVFTIYLDGTAVSSADLGETTLVDNTFDWGIGEDGSEVGGTEFFNGQIDEVKIWHTARTPEQLLAFKDVELNGSEPGLVGYWNFENGGGSTIPDLASGDGAQNGAMTDMDVAGDYVQHSTVGDAGMLDATAPTPNITTVGSGTNSPITVDIDFGEEVVNLDETDLAVTNAIVNNFMGVDGQNYTVDLYPNADGNVTVDMAGGAANDLTGNASNAATQFSITATLQNNALDFAASDYVNIPHDPLFDLASPFTVEFWIKTSASVGTVWLEKGTNNQEWSIQQFNDHVYMNFGNGGLESNISINDGKWHHVAIVYRGSTNGTIYIDGVDETNGATNTLGTPDYVTYDGAVSIGGRVGGSFDLEGAMDEVRIWNDERTIGEIQSNQYNTLVGNEANLVAYYRFDETGGTILPDLSANTLDGTLTNMTGTEWTASGAMTPESPFLFNATDVSTSGFTANFSAPAGAIDILVDVDDAPDFASPIAMGISVGASGSAPVSVSLTSGTQYYYRAKADHSTNGESDYVVSNSFMVQSGNTLTFSSSDYVNIPHDPLLDLAGDFTVEFWFNHTTSGNVIILEKGNNNQEWSIQQSTGNEIILNVGNNITQTTQTYNDGNWHHAAVVYRGVDDASIFIDGVDDTDVVAVGTPDYVTFDGNLNIGGRAATSSYAGLLDELRIWDDERTIGEIQSYQYNTLVGNEANLVAYYRFDETGGTILPDLSANTLDGMLTNMTGTEWTASGAMTPESPFLFNATDVSTSGFTANFSAPSGAIDILVDVDDAPDFASPIATGISVGVSGSAPVSVSLTSGTQYYYRAKADHSTNGESDYVVSNSFFISPGNALDFDGVNDYIDLFEDEAFVGDFTVEAWVYITDFTDYSPILSKQGTTDNNTAEFNLQVQGPINGNISFFLGTGSGIASVSGNDADDQDIMLNTWTHVAATVEGTTMSLYINGALSGSGTFTGARQNSAAPVQVGHFQNSVAQYWPGQIDEVRIWDYARNATEISDNTYNTLVGNEAGLISYYRFDETAGLVLPDLSVNELDGILTNMAGTEWSPSGALTISTLNVKINEVVTDPATDWSTNGFDGTDGGGAVSDIDQYVELYVGEAGLDFTTGWSLEIYEDDGSTLRFSGDLTNTGAFDVVTYFTSGSGTISNSEVGDYIILGNPDGSNSLVNNVDLVLLNGFEIDRVDLGGTIDQAPNGASSGTADESVSRKPNGADSDSDDDDFQKAEATPGTTNDNNALSFDGVDSYVDFGDVTTLDGLSSLTIEGWFNTNVSPYFTASDEHYSIIAKGEMTFAGNNSAGIYFRGTDGGGDLIARVGTDVGTETASFVSTNVNTNEWYHVALVWSSGTHVELYLNGALVGTSSSTLAGTINDIAEPLSIGFSNNGAEQYFDGEVDEIRIWSVARTQEQIVDNAYSSITSGPISSYTFNNSSGPLIDAAGSNDGSLVGGVSYEVSDAWAADVFAPIFEGIYPTADTETIDGFDINVELNEGSSQVAYSILANPSSAPALDDIGTVGDAAGIISVTDASTFYNETVTGLSASTNYDIFLLPYDGNSNRPSSATVIAALTLDPPNYALDFDGTDDLISVGTGTSLQFENADQFTIEAWVNTATGTGNRSIAGNELNAGTYRGYIFFLDGNVPQLLIRSDFNGGSSSDELWVAASNAISTSQWHHVAVTYDGSTAAAGIKLYVDGTVQSVTVISDNLTGSILNGNEFNIGSRDQAEALFSGQIDEVRVWNVARSESQIDTFKDVELNGGEPGLLGYWNFSDGPGDDNVPDVSGNGNPGTMFNMDNATDYVAAAHGVAPAGALDSTSPTLPTVSIGLDDSGNNLFGRATDKVLLTFTSDEDITNVDVFFSSDGAAINNAVTILGGPLNWTAEYIMSASDNEGSVTFQIDFEDLTGNSGTAVFAVTDGSSVVFDNTAPTITGVTLSGDNTLLTVDFDEDIFSDEDGFNSVVLANMSVTVEGGVASVTETALRVNSPTQVEIDLTVGGSPDGSEIVKVEPGALTYDAAGNQMAATQSNNTVNLNAPYVVSNTSPAGPGSLRDAIINANASGAKETITFSIAAGSVIALDDTDGVLPTITNVNGMILDATTATDWSLSSDELIVIDGTSLSSTVDGAAFRIGATGANIEIYGFKIQNFSQGLNDGVIIEGDNNTFGKIGGENVVVQNNTGIQLEGSSNVIQSNYIGRDFADNDLGNLESGIVLPNGASDNQIGGENPGEGNYIFYNGTTASHYGVRITGSTSLRNQVIGNSMSCNEGGGFDLNNIASTPHNDIIRPTIDYITPSEISGTVDPLVAAGSDVHVYESTDVCDQKQGVIYLGKTTVFDDAGTKRFSYTGTFTSNSYSATLTTTTDGTSEMGTAGYYEVNITEDSGDGSLRKALELSNAIDDQGFFIDFNLGGAGPWTISPASDLGTISSSLTMDGSTEVNFNLTSGQIITIDGANSGNDILHFTPTGDDKVEIANLRFINANNNVINSVNSGNLSLHVHDNVFGASGDAGVDEIIYITSGSLIEIENNYFGFDHTGTGISEQITGSAISISDFVDDVIIKGNTIGNYSNSAIVLGGINNSALVENNIIGLNFDAKEAAPATSAISDGIIINGNNVVVRGNYIGNVQRDAIKNLTFGLQNIAIQANTIGTDVDGDPHPVGTGIYLDDRPGYTNFKIGGLPADGNTITNATEAIHFENDGSQDTDGVRITANSIFGNTAGIVTNGANASVSEPTITSLTTSAVSGTGSDGDIIHLYLGDGSGQPQTLMDSAYVVTGSWNFGSLSLSANDEVVVAASSSTATSDFVAASLTPDINVKFAGSPIGIGEAIDLSWSFVGQSGATEQVDVENTGFGALNIASITGSPTHFAVSNISSTPISGQTAEHFTVQFAPGTSGTISENITINNDDTDESAYMIQLEGFGYPNESGSGMALDFDGTDDHVTINPITDLSSTDKFTIEGWFNQNTIDVQGGMFGQILSSTAMIRARTWNDGYLYLYVHNGSSAYGRFDYSQYVYGGEWFHLAMVYDGSQTGNSNRLKAYVNGEEVILDYLGTIPASTASLSGANFYLAENVNIATAGNHWHGQIDEVRIWRDAVSQGDIQSYMLTNDLTGHPQIGSDDLAAYYRFDEGEGETLYDLSFDNHGVLTNMDQATDWVPSGALIPAPQIVSQTPEVDATGVVPNTTITVIFDQNVQAGAGNIAIRTQDDNIVEQFDVAAAVNFSGTSVTFTPTQLSYNEIYSITIPQGAIMNLSGKSIAAITLLTAWSFTTQAQTLTVTQPDGGSPLEVGSTVNIQWTSDGNGMNIGDGLEISFSDNGGGSFDDIIYSGPLSNHGDEFSGTFSWVVPGPSISNRIIRVFNTTAVVFDDSPDLNIVGPTITHVATEDATDCISPFGSITIGGLIANESYDVIYDFESSPVAPESFLTDGSGDLEIPFLSVGSYTNIQVQIQSATSNVLPGPFDVFDNTVSPVLSVTPTDNTVCAGDPDGAASVTITNDDTGTYTYEWFVGSDTSTPASDGSVPGVSTSGSTTAILSGVPAGQYTVRVTDDQSPGTGCEEVITITILDNLINPTITPVNATSTNPSSIGNNDGQINASNVAPTSADNYTFQWYFGADTSTPLVDFSNPGNGSNPDGATSHTVDGLAAGDYTLVITENETGCVSDPVTFTLTDPASNPVLTITDILPNTTTVGIDMSVDLTSDIYFVVTQSETVPTVAQVVAGQDEFSIAADFYGVITTVDGSISFTLGENNFGPQDQSLTTENTYNVYFVADAGGGSYSLVEGGIFTTGFVASGNTVHTEDFNTFSGSLNTLQSSPPDYLFTNQTLRLSNAKVTDQSGYPFGGTGYAIQLADGGDSFWTLELVDLTRVGFLWRSTDGGPSSIKVSTSTDGLNFDNTILYSVTSSQSYEAKAVDFDTPFTGYVKVEVDGGSQLLVDEFYYETIEVVTNPFVTTWLATGGTITIPTNTASHTYNYDVTWTNITNPDVAEGSLSSQTGDAVLSGLEDGSDYFVEISGQFPAIYFANTAADKDKIMTIEQWGDIAWESMQQAFMGCSNLDMAATDYPDLSGVTNMSQMFRATGMSFSGDFSGWDVSNVTNISFMFSGSQFDGNIDSWDVSNVTDMSYLFYVNPVFNGNISGWVTSSVVNMSRAFSHTSVFNQNIGGWDVSNVTQMEGMFNQSFQFDQDLSSWDVSKVTRMDQMFRDANSFDSDITTWVTSSLTNMSRMFQGADLFNQDISGWDVSQVSTMDNVFNTAPLFDRDLSAWDISFVTDMTSMLDNSGLSVANYDIALAGWSTLDGGEAQIPTSITLGAIGLEYSASGLTSRDVLTNSPYFWTITGDSEEQTAPTNQAQGVNLTNVMSSAFDVSWGNGDGDSRLVAVKEITVDLATAGFPAPADGISYTANQDYTLAEEIGTSGWFVVARGALSPGITVTGLTPNVEYAVAVLEYNSAGDLYNTSQATGNPSSDFTLSALTINFVSSVDATCGNFDGSITIDGLSPSSSYDVYFDLDPDGFGSSSDGPYPFSSNATGELTITGLGPGVYDQLYVDDAGNLSNNLGGIELTGLPPTIENEIENASFTDCSSPDGEYELTISAFPNTSSLHTVKLYEGLSVDAGSEIFTNNSVGTDVTFFGLSGGNHTAEITDNDTGCITVTSFSITDDTDPPVINAGGVDIINPSSSGANDGSIDAFDDVTGGSASYDYLWYLGTDTQQPTVESGNDAVALTGFPAGTYTLVVHDDVSGCSSAPATFTLVDPTTAASEDFSSLSNISYNGSVSLPSGDWFITNGFGEDGNTRSAPMSLALPSGGSVITPLLDGDNTNVSFWHAASGGETTIEVFQSVDGGANVSLGTVALNAPFEEYTLNVDEGVGTFVELTISVVSGPGVAILDDFGFTPFSAVGANFVVNTTAD